jgi:propanediol dehydratase small subunit
MQPFTIAFIFLLALVAGLSFIPNSQLKAYWSRKCTGKAWRTAFPRSSKSEIRIFLNLFADSFFDPSKALFFKPDDKIMDIYKAIYSTPYHSGGDACECESFVVAFIKLYGIDPRPIWSNELTLGQLFIFAHAPNH